jgi:hypothetical protein
VLRLDFSGPDHRGLGLAPGLWHAAKHDFIQHALAKAFWRYFTDDTMHSFYEPGSEAESQAFATPPWERADTGP